MNAHEATPPGGMVRIELAVRADHATVAVVDTGGGIPAGILERVFDPFFTTKARGSGLPTATTAALPSPSISRSPSWPRWRREHHPHRHGRRRAARAPRLGL